MRSVADRSAAILFNISGRGNLTIVVGIILAGMIAMVLVQAERCSTKSREKTKSDLQQMNDHSKTELPLRDSDKADDLVKAKQSANHAEEHKPTNGVAARPSSAKTRPQGENEYWSEHEGSSWAPDPLPKLKTFEKIVKASDVKERTETSFRHALHHAFQLGDLRTKLIDLEPLDYIRFKVDKTYWFRTELETRPDGRFIFQDEKVFPNLEDSRLRVDIPICIVQFEKSQDPHAHHDAEFSLSPVTKKHPTNSVRNFRGVKIQTDLPIQYDIGIRSIECGFISDLAPTDDYLRLELMHLLGTVGFN